VGQHNVPWYDSLNWTYYTSSRWLMSMGQWWNGNWQGKIKAHREKPDSAPFCPLQIQHGVTLSLNLGLHGVKPATNHVSYSITLSHHNARKNETSVVWTVVMLMENEMSVILTAIMLRQIRHRLSTQQQRSENMKHVALIYFSFFLLNLLKYKLFLMPHRKVPSHPEIV
jgi:hypothetical protein